MFIHPSVGRHLGCFYFFIIIKNSLINICVQVFVGMLAFILGIYLALKLLGLMGTLCLITWETVIMFSKWTAPFKNLIISVWVLQFLHILASNCYYLFYYSHPSGCEVVAHCGFSLHFLDSLWYSASSYVIISHMCMFFGEMFIQILCPFKNWVIFLLILSCKPYLNIWIKVLY